MRLGKYEELNEQQQEIVYKKYGCLIDCAIDREIDGLKQQMAIEVDSNFGIKIKQKSINIHNDGIYGINIFYLFFAIFYLKRTCIETDTIFANKNTQMFVNLTYISSLLLSHFIANAPNGILNQ